ncbi:hypothetical protein QBC40DRAFT_24004 [Triangularia verruculosa]|uniref:Azaphilone pigments biosynthesis cluster protein L N-terminal domain-containing protein n=1 Tax=Triangularia verruculosa TaxID=2587418 RepID=A0AAN7AZZ2_9PEZI|nr:hypothetical protein QBC40DRAFT_24004 [Triangularia verruculosa]
MAEAIGLTASAIAIAAFAGQLAQGAAFLYNIAHTYKDAPKEIQRLSDEIGAMGSILTNIEATFNNPTATPDPDLSLALRLCENVINGLTQDLAKLGTTQIKKARKRVLKRFKASLRLSDLAKHAAALERAKSTLLQCCAGKSWTVQVANSATLQAVQASVDGVGQAVANARQAVTDTTQAVKALEQPLSRIELAAVGTQQSLAAVIESNARVEECQLKTYTIVDRLESETLSLRQEFVLAVKSISQDIANQLKNSNSEMKEAITHDLEQAITYASQELGGEICQDRAQNHSLSTTQTQISNSQPRFSSNLQPQKTDLQASSASRWVRKSSTITWNRTARYTLFGTLIAQTVNTSYTRASSGKTNDKEEDLMIRSESQTTITFLPAPWLSWAGAKFQYGAIVRPAPKWSLRAVNVISEDSEIFTALKDLDVFCVRDLFDSGQASPFDVDDGGRNLLGHLALGSRILDKNAVLPPKAQIDDRLELFEVLLEMLLSYGVDASEFDLHEYNPLILVMSCWFEYKADVGELYNDKLQHILNRLLRSARSDPLVSWAGISAVADLDSYYTLEEFPNDTSGRQVREIASSTIRVLLAQDVWEWELPWANPEQVTLACSLGYNAFPKSVRFFVGFWVTSTHEQAMSYLERKKVLIDSLIQNSGELRLRHSAWEKALHATIHGGAEVIALLSEHDRGAHRAPWLRHRFRKLVLVRKHMLYTLTLLLRLGGKALADPQLLDRVSEHAESHNARTFFAWSTALKKAGQSFGHVPPEQCFSRSSDEVDEVDEVDEWETERSVASDSDSGWETVEEWEEGYSVKTAIDREKQEDYGDNLEVCSCGRQKHRGDDIDFNYDEEYWEHVYSRIETSNYDSPPKVSKSDTLKRLKAAASAARDFISYIT